MPYRFYTLKSLGIGLPRWIGALRAGFTQICRDARRKHPDGIPMWHESRNNRGSRRSLRGQRFVLAVGMLGFLAGCAGLGGRIDAGTPEEQKQKIVAERADARWQALIKGDLDTAYTYLSPASRATTSLALYKAKIRPGIWRAAKADKVSCKAEVCTVTMLVTFDAKAMKGIQAPVMESWIIEDGAAWFVYR